MNSDARPTATTTSVLTVCAANVCRSPAMAFMLEHALGREGLAPPWTIASAGASAVPGQEMCERSAAAVRRMPGGGAFSEQHHSRLLTSDLIGSAGLILAASAKERAAVARLVPAARQRTFTLREAVLLLERAAERERSGPCAVTGEELVLDAVVDALNRQRGTLAQSLTPGGARRKWPRRRGPLSDIGDVHAGEERSHKPVLGAIRGDTGRFARAAARLAAAPAFQATSA